MCVRLKELYMKQDNTQPNLMMYYIFHSVPPPPLHPHSHMRLYQDHIFHNASAL